MSNFQLCISKTTKIGFVLLLLCVTKICSSQEIRKENNFKADVFLPSYYFIINSSAFSFSYEHQIKNNHGLQMSLQYSTDKNLYGSYKTFQLVPIYKFYFNKLYKGYYTGTYLKYINYHVKINKTNNSNSIDDSYEFIQHKGAFGILNGYLFYIGKKKRILVDPIIGIGFSQVLKTEFVKKGNYSFNKNRLDAIVALNIGYRF